MEQQPDKKTIGPRWDFCVSLVVMSSPDHLMIYTVSVPNRSLASIVWCWEVSNNSWRNSIRLPLLKRLFIFNKWYFTFVKWLLLKVKQFSKQLQRLGKMFLKDLSLYIYIYIVSNLDTICTAYRCLQTVLFFKKNIKLKIQISISIWMQSFH